MCVCDPAGGNGAQRNAQHNYACGHVCDYVCMCECDPAGGNVQYVRILGLLGQLLWLHTAARVYSMCMWCMPCRALLPWITPSNAVQCPVQCPVQSCVCVHVYVFLCVHVCMCVGVNAIRQVGRPSTMSSTSMRVCRCAYVCECICVHVYVCDPAGGNAQHNCTHTRSLMHGPPSLMPGHIPAARDVMCC